MFYKGYEIIREYGYYAVYDNGFFVSSADTVTEAKADIDEMEVLG